MELTPYPTYKPSGVDWLGDIPLNWEVKKLKYVLSKVIGGGTPSTTEKAFWDGEIPWVSPKDMKVEIITDTQDYVTDLALENSATTFVPDGSVLIVVRSGILKHTFPVAINAVDVTLNQDMKALIPTANLSNQFLKWLLKGTQRFILTYCSKLGATVDSIETEALFNFAVAYPPLTEQTAIVNFLDAQTNRLDQLIARKRRMIELLRDERAGLINDAVTKGLNPNAPRRDSGLSWLGEIPAHWRVKKLKYIAKIKYGLGQPPKQKDDGLPLIRATNVERGRVVEKDLLFVDPDDVPYDRDPILKKDDIIVVRSGAYTADSAIIPEKYEGAIAGYDMVVRVSKGLAKFIAFGLLSHYVLYNQLYLNRLRAAQPHLNKEELSDTVFALPSINEQAKIIDHIEDETAQIDLTVGKIEQEIALLNEYRSALISEAVTGKIKVS